MNAVASPTDSKQLHSKQSGATAANRSGSRLLQACLRPRRELQFAAVKRSRDRTQAAARWIVFDPISRQSYRIGWLEHWWLTRFDGRQTVAQLLHKFRQLETDAQVTDAQLLQQLEQFIQSSLVHAPFERPKRPVNSWTSMISSLVVWRIRGWQPDRWLGYWAPHTDFLFSGTAVKNWLMLAVLSAAGVLLEFQRLIQQSNLWDWMLRPTTGGMLLLVFVATRAAHELGHALVCKRYSVRCPDIGVFLILGAPCVYCDVSESWRLPSRRQRAAVAAAGMYVELIVASLAAWVWMMTVDGPINTLALQTMFVCSVSTVLININPLMRFDGYYLLADWLDESNLRARADGLAFSHLQQIVLGSRKHSLVDRPSVWRQRALCVFSVAGWLYRALLSATIAAVLISLYAQWNLLWLGRILATIVLFSWWGLPMLKLTKNLWRAADTAASRWRLGIAAALVVIAAAVVPLPHRRFASGWIQPVSVQGVFAANSARLAQSYATDGQSVSAGQPLFEMQNTQLVLQAMERESAVLAAEAKYRAHKRQRDMHGQDVDLRAYDSDVDTARNLATNALDKLDSLRLLAPVDGIFIAAPAPPVEDPATSDYPLDWSVSTQVGRTVPQGTLLGSVCSRDAIAVIPLREAQLADVTTGSHVRLRIPEDNCRVALAQVQSIVQFDQVSHLWRTYMQIPRSSDNPSGLNSASTQYAAIVEVPKSLQGRPGTSIDAVFVTPSATLAQLGTRWLKANLRWMAD